MLLNETDFASVYFISLHLEAEILQEATHTMHISAWAVTGLVAILSFHMLMTKAVLAKT